MVSDLLRCIVPLFALSSNFAFLASAIALVIPLVVRYITSNVGSMTQTEAQNQILQRAAKRQTLQTMTRMQMLPLMTKMQTPMMIQKRQAAPKTAAAQKTPIKTQTMKIKRPKTMRLQNQRWGYYKSF